jgi:cytoskeleton protein RodZ
LRIDSAPVLAKLPGAQRAPLATADRTLKSNIVSGTPRWNGSRSNGLPSRALLIVVALLLVGAAVLFWLPQSAFDQVGAAVSRWTARGETETGSVTEAPAVAAAPGGASVVENTPVSPVPPAATGPATAAAPGTPVAPAAPGAPSATALPAANAAATVAAPAAGGGQPLVFVAREDCWITVTEAGGKQLLRRIVQAGETVGLSGALPLSVVVGRASAVDVQVRGKPYDLKPVTRGGGVARFEVTS